MFNTARSSKTLFVKRHSLDAQCKCSNRRERAEENPGIMEVMRPVDITNTTKHNRDDGEHAKATK